MNAGTLDEINAKGKWRKPVALVHEYLLAPNRILNESLNRIYDYKNYSMKTENLVLLDDDLFGYMDDSFKWFSTYDPIKGVRMQGFNYYGISYIDNECAGAFVSVISAWRTLFSTASDELTLTGPYTWLEGESLDSGKYEKLTYNKREVLDTLINLERLGDKVLKENYTIIYFGI